MSRMSPFPWGVTLSETSASTVCLFNYGPTMAIQSINNEPLRYFVIAGYRACAWNSSRSVVHLPFDDECFVEAVHRPWLESS